MRLSVFMKACLFVITMLITGITNATNYYVDPSSTASSQNGAAATPWKTLAQVQSNMSLFQAGDIISFKRGQNFSGQLTISRSGSSTAPITFNAYGTGANPVFTGTGSRIEYLVYIQNRSYITIDGITITDPTISQTDRTVQSKIERAFYLDGSTNHVIIQNCQLSLVGVGMYFVGPSNTIDHCDIGNLRMVVNTNDGGYDDYGANPVVISSASNRITNNYFHDCWATSYDFGYDGGAVELYGPGTDNNVIAYNTMYDCNGLMEVGSGDGGSSNNNIVAYNKLINNESMIYLQNSGTFAISCNNFQFYNNVIVENVVGRLHESRLIGSASTPPSGTLVLRNNVFQLSSGIDVASSAWNSQVHTNNVYKLTNSSVSGLTLSASEMSTSNAIFTNTTPSVPTQWDYMPVVNSPVIDYGQNVGLIKDFAGNNVPSVPNSGILENASAPAILVAASSATAIACNGGNATVTVTATGGTPPYTGTGTFTTGAGAHSYTVTDATGATASTSLTITQPNPISGTISAGTIIIFGGVASATVTAAGGTSPYTYSLDGGAFQSNNIFNTILAGTHAVIIKDANGCTGNSGFVLTQPASLPLAAVSSSGTISCNGGSTNIAVTASGGTAPYTGTGSFSVSAGTYSYNVTDAAGSTATTSITVTQPSAISVTVSAGTILIFGGTTSVSLNATGGTGSYTYKLNSGSYQSSSIFNNVAAGSHAITVKDANGCTSLKNFTITQPASNPLVAASTATGISCNGGTATVTVTAAGGTTPYTGAGTFTVNAGTYNYTVTDANGSASTTSITVTQPLAINATITAGTILVNGGTTTASVSATGGNAPYMYKLNPGAYQASNTFNNIAAGSYTITVKDANGCTSVKNFTVTEPSPILASSTSGFIACNGGTTTVTVSANGGTSPYTGTGTFTVSAGTYSYTVTDANGATSITTITVIQPAAIIATATAGAITTFGGTTSVTINATGGTGSYSYSLDGSAYQSSNFFSDIPAGTHAIAVTDANGCTGTSSLLITAPGAPAPLNVTSTGHSVNCNGGTTTVTVSANGGTPPYTGTGTFVVAAGTFNYTVTDAAGVTAITSVTITQPAAIVVTVSAGAIVVAGGTTTITVTASGGTGVYSYSLNGAAFQASNVFTNVAAGSYSVTVKDINGCSSAGTVTITQPTSFRISLVSKTNVQCMGGSTGSLEVLAFGGRAPYQYNINSGRYSTAPLFKNLRAGIYRVNAKDANNNIISLLVYIYDGRRRCSTGGTVLTDGGRVSVNAYPNPTATAFSLEVDSDTEDEVLIEVMNLNGTKVYETKGPAYKKFIFGENFLSGSYFVRVTQGKDVKTLRLIKAK